MASSDLVTEGQVIDLVAAIVADANAKLRKSIIRQDTDSAPLLQTTFTDTLLTSLENTFEGRVGGTPGVEGTGTLRRWDNEWHAYRARAGVYAAYADAGVRFVIEDGDYVGTSGNGGNAIDIENRRGGLTGRAKHDWGRMWDGGTLIRGGARQVELMAWKSSDDDPTTGGTISRPTHVRYVIFLAPGDSVPSWATADDIVFRFNAGASGPAVIDETLDDPWGATHSGFKAWNFDPTGAGGSQALGANGTVYVQKLYTHKPISVTNLHLHVGTAGATLTSGQNFAGLFSSGKALLAATADQSAVWNSTGMKTMALSGGAQSVPAGYFYVAVFANATTRPAFVRGSNIASVNGILSAANARFATADTGRTTSFPSTLGAFTSASNGYWCGVS